MPRLSFGPALPLGMSSRSEFVDAILLEEVAPAAIMNGLNAELPEGIRILDALPIDSRTPSIQAAIAEWSFSTRIPSEDMLLLVATELRGDAWRERSVTTSRPGKHRERVFRLGDEVTSVSLHEQELRVTLRLRRDGASLPAAAAIRAFLSLPADQPLEITKSGVTESTARPIEVDGCKEGVSGWSTELPVIHTTTG